MQNGKKNNFVSRLLRSVALFTSPLLREELEGLRFDKTHQRMEYEESRRTITRLTELLNASKDRCRGQVVRNEILVSDIKKLSETLVKMHFDKGTLEQSYLTATKVLEVLTSSPEPIKRDILCMPFRLGSISGNVYGGPYKDKPEDLIGIKMAEEIKLPCVVDVPTVDFSVPDPEALRRGLLQAVLYLKQYGEVYVGCWGGIGRTGLFMAGLAKIMIQGDEVGCLYGDGSVPEEIAIVRHFYKEHAVETKQQVEYIKNLKVDDIIESLFAVCN